MRYFLYLNCSGNYRLHFWWNFMRLAQLALNNFNGLKNVFNNAHSFLRMKKAKNYAKDVQLVTQNMGKNLQIYFLIVIWSQLRDSFAAVYTKPLCLINVPVFILHTKDSICWVHGNLVLSSIPDKSFRISKSNIAGSGSVTLNEYILNKNKCYQINFWLKLS